MEKRAAREFDHPDPAIRLHDRQERDGFGADNRRDGHPAQRVGQRILHRVERQRLHPPGKPHPRIGTGGARFRRKENPQAVHQIVRQIHLCRDTRTARTGTDNGRYAGNGAGSQSCGTEKAREKTSGAQCTRNRHAGSSRRGTRCCGGPPRRTRRCGEESRPGSGYGTAPADHSSDRRGFQNTARKHDRRRRRRQRLGLPRNRRRGTHQEDAGFRPPQLRVQKTVAAGKIPFENSRDRRAPVGK